MSSLRQLFYLSRSKGVTESDVQQILLRSRQKNWRMNVTGCLMFSGKHFAQTLEGDPFTLGEITLRIAADPRHTDFRVLLDREVPTRHYPDWSMGYLYSMELADRLEAALSLPPVAEGEAVELMSLIVADSTMGPL